MPPATPALAAPLYNIIVPSNASEENRLPALYILHGASGNSNDWVEKTNVRQLAEQYQMILVFPNGRAYGWYIDSPELPDSQMASRITEVIIPEVDAKFPTINDPKARAIMGLSMGGHGALKLAIQRPDLFGSASSLSGVLDITAHPNQWELDRVLGPIERHRDRWEANSVTYLAPRLREMDLPILFDCGVDDQLVLDENDRLHQILTEWGVPHIYRRHPGRHSWEYWGGHLQEHLNFHQANMMDSLPNAERWFGLYYRRLKGFFDENRRLAVSARPEKRTVAILGSSSAQGFPDDLLPEYHLFNRGIAADRLGITGRGVTKRMEESLFDMQPDVVVFKIGRNDLGAAARGDSMVTHDRMMEEYAVVTSAVRDRLPNALLIVTTSFPVRGNYAHLKEPVVEWNTRLKAFAARSGIAVIDLHPKLVDGEGLLREEFTNDGLHLTRPAYELWAAEIRRVIEANPRPR
jgi:S-formylglutathione hydrolase FrmB/lysophospholipase L1-like esterase